MFRVLSILAIVLAVWLPLLDYGVFRPRRRAAGHDGPLVRGAEWAIYGLFLIALAVMAITSILMLAFGQRMHGWMLILHMSFAPLYALCIAALAILWADTHSAAASGRGARIAFWWVIASSFVTIASAMLLMMTWFGSIGQEKLLTVHRVSAMVLLVAASYQAGRLCCSCCSAERPAVLPDAPQA